MTVRIVLERGDLTEARVDAVVNAANPRLLGGGGVDGAIHRAAGPRLLEACRALPAVDGVRCPYGEARVTPGFDLHARWVIHAVGPVYGSDEDPHATLDACHRASLRLAREKGCASIAFPAISCGAFGFPPDEAAPIALRAVREDAGGVHEVRFVLFGEDTLAAWVRARDAAS